MTAKAALAGLRLSAACRKAMVARALPYAEQIRWLRAQRLLGKNYFNHAPAVKEYKRLWALGQKRPELLEGQPVGAGGKILVVLDPDQPAPTICAMPTMLVHWREDRCLAVEEVRRLCGFPEDFCI